VNFHRIKQFNTPDDDLDNATSNPSQFALGIKIIQERKTAYLYKKAKNVEKIKIYV